MSNALFDRLFSVVQAAPACGNGDAADAALRLGRELVSIHDGNGRSIDPIKLSTLMTKWNTRNPTPIEDQELRKIVSAAYRQPDQPATRQTGPRVQPMLQLASSIAPKGTDWIWHGRIERGALALLAGDPGAAKSLLTVDIVARLSTGAAWPDDTYMGHREPVSSIILAAEDDAARAIVPRLKAAKADLSRVGILKSVCDGKRTRSIALDRDLGAIEAAVSTMDNVRLLVLDPLDSFTTKADGNDNHELRGLLEPLVAFAERLDLGILLVKHLSKPPTTANQTAAIYRVSGAMLYTALPRTVMIVAKDADDADLRVLCSIKCSHARRPAPLGYRISTNPDGAPTVGWEPVHSDSNADDLLQGRGRKRETRTDNATTWLESTLRTRGPMLTTDLVKLAEAEGIARRLLEDARARLREQGRLEAVQVRDQNTCKGAWQVSLKGCSGA
jgi:hypothetical protein